MKKLFTLFISLILIILMCFILIRNSFLDRFNPLIKMEYSYAKVPKDTQKYEDIIIYDDKGNKLDYTLTFKGYDSSQIYVKIQHKGYYVKQIEYVNKNEFPRNIR